jgi:hypothetical protein
LLQPAVGCAQGEIQSLVWLAVFKTVARDGVSRVGSIPASFRRFFLDARECFHRLHGADLSEMERPLAALPSVHEVLHNSASHSASAHLAELYRTRLVRQVIQRHRERLRDDPSVGYVQKACFYLDFRTPLPDDLPELQRALDELSLNTRGELMRCD